MLKKILTLFLLIVVYIFSFIGIADAASRKLANPRYIKTYIQPNHKYTVMMKHAFAEWTRLTNKKFVFHYVSSPNVAKIDVYFVKKIDTMNQRNLDRAIGLTKGTGTNTRITHAVIYIADLTQDGRKLNRDEIYTVMLHEIGHAIGLEHSNDPESVMFPGVNVIQEISKKDLNTLKRLYGWE